MESLRPVGNQRVFQIAWESTLKCNLDCSYCSDGHDNSVEHPSLEDSKKTLDFIVEYVNLYMKTKADAHKFANLNIQGGESIFHPDIISILEYARTKKSAYSDWGLNISLITNAVIGQRSWQQIASLVDFFTISYHAESLPKQQDMIRTNILHLKSLGKNFYVAVLMHPKHWDNCVSMVNWCKANDIKVHTRQIDHPLLDFRFNYNAEQIEYLTGMPKVPVTTKIISIFKNGIDLSAAGRSCCGGDTLCVDNSQEVTFVKGNKFKGWHCSVNKFFLYIRQSTGEIYTNKDCRMNFNGDVAPIGNLKHSKELLEDLAHKIETDTLPDIVCKKSSCWCGLCAPKAATKEMFDQLMEPYNVNTGH